MPNNLVVSLLFLQRLNMCMKTLFLSKKAMVAIVLGLSLIGAGSASAMSLGLFKEKARGQLKMWVTSQEGSFDLSVDTPSGWAAGSEASVSWTVDYAQVEGWIKEFEEENGELLDRFPHERNLQAMVYLIKEGMPAEWMEKKERMPEIAIEHMSYKKTIFIGQTDVDAGSIGWTVPEFIPAGDDYKVGVAIVWAPAGYSETHPGLLDKNPKPYLLLAKYKMNARKIAYAESDLFSITNVNDQEDIEDRFQEMKVEIEKKKDDMKVVIHEHEEDWKTEMRELRSEIREVREEVRGIRALLGRIGNWFKFRWGN